MNSGPPIEEAAAYWSQVVSNLANALLCLAAVLILFPGIRYRVLRLLEQAMYELAMLEYRARTQPPPAWWPHLGRPGPEE